MVQAAFVGEGTSVAYLEPLRINEETETREILRTRRYYNPLARIFRASFVLILAYSYEGSGYYNMLAHLRLYKELLDSTDLLFRPEKAT